MFKTRLDRMTDLVDLYHRLDPSKMVDLLNDVTITQKADPLRDALKSEIESFSSFLIDNLFEFSETIDIPFVEKTIEYDPTFTADVLSTAISKHYSSIGFNKIFKLVSQIKNVIAAFYCCQVLYKNIIYEGEKHRNEACDLKAKLDEMSKSDGFNKLTEDQRANVTEMLERLKPHARPVIKQKFYHKDFPIPEGEENGVSYPVFSKSGNWAEHDLLMSVFMDQHREKEQKMKKVLKKGG